VLLKKTYLNHASTVKKVSEHQMYVYVLKLEESIYSKGGPKRRASTRRRRVGRRPRRMYQQLMVGEVARGLSLFGGASSEVRRCNCSSVVF
jgi:hypothetical protein